MHAIAHIHSFVGERWNERRQGLLDGVTAREVFVVVVENISVFHMFVHLPETDVNADVPELGNNLSLHDPRNYKLKKHMVRLAVYELTKLIAPNNVSAVRMRDYEDSMKWLNDAAKLRLNPQIPRKVDETKKPVTDWQLATFQTDYDPYRNPWMV